MRCILLIIAIGAGLFSSGSATAQGLSSEDQHQLACFMKRSARLPPAVRDVLLVVNGQAVGRLRIPGNPAEQCQRVVEPSASCRISYVKPAAAVHVFGAEGSNGAVRVDTSRAGSRCFAIP